MSGGVFLLRKFLLISLAIFLLLQVRGVKSASVSFCDISAVLAQETLTDEDFALVFSQTGLGKTAVYSLLDADDADTILGYQQSFFAERYVDSDEVLGVFVRCDVLVDEEGEPINSPDFAEIRAGDILLTLSTYTLGWRHGHLAMYLGDGLIIESTTLGDCSVIRDMSQWQRCASYVVLRPIGITDEQSTAVAEYAKTVLCGVPYGIYSTLFSSETALYCQCADLVWLAYAHFGYDLDGNGGAFVLPADFLASDKLEVLQIYGFDPSLFLG